MSLLFLESIGTTELLVILVVALVVFGPRRLPEIGRKLGKGMAEFRRAGDDFKRTWEREVELERTTAPARPDEPSPALAAGTPAAARGEETSAGPFVFESENSIARGPRARSNETAEAQPQTEATTTADPAAPRHEQLGKADWL